MFRSTKKFPFIALAEVALCLFGLSLDSSVTENTIANELIEIHEENSQSISTWFGSAKMFEQVNGRTFQVDVSFGIDRIRDINFFVSSIGGKGNYRWKTGQYQNGTNFVTLDSTNSSSSVCIRNHGMQKRYLNPGTFDPMCVFRPMEDEELRPWLTRLLGLRDQDSFDISIGKVSNLITISVGSKGSELTDSVFVFDLHKGGNLVSICNPGPIFTLAVEVDYSLHQGVWLPRKLTRKQIGAEEATRLIEFQNQSVNEICDPNEMTFDHVFELPNGATIRDETKGKQYKFFDDANSALKFRLEDQAFPIEETIKPRTRSLYSIIFWSGAGACLLVAISAFLTRNFSKVIAPNIDIIGFGLFLGIPILIACFHNYTPKLSGEKTLDSTRDKFENLFCGHYSLIRACRSVGIEMDEPHVAKLLPVRKAGNSMLELQNALQVCGLASKGVYRSLDELSRVDLPCIAQLKSPDHYITLVSRKESTPEENCFMALDGQKGRLEIEPDDLADRWSGNILVMQEKNIDGANAIDFDSLDLELGTIGFTPRITNEFRFTNRSNAAVRVIDVHTSCDCLSSSFDDGWLTPGEQSGIVLTFEVAKKAKLDGAFSHSAVVEFETETEGNLLRELRISGRIQSNFYADTSLADFGNVSSEESQSLVIPIHFNSAVDFDNPPKVIVEDPEFMETQWKVDLAFAGKEKKTIPLQLTLRAPKTSQTKILDNRITLVSQLGFGLVLRSTANVAPKVRCFPGIFSGRISHGIRLISKDEFSINEQLLRDRWPCRVSARRVIHDLYCIEIVPKLEKLERPCDLRVPYLSNGKQEEIRIRLIPPS